MCMGGRVVALTGPVPVEGVLEGGVADDPGAGEPGADQEACDEVDGAVHAQEQPSCAVRRVRPAGPRVRGTAGEGGRTENNLSAPHGCEAGGGEQPGPLQWRLAQGGGVGGPPGAVGEEIEHERDGVDGVGGGDAVFELVQVALPGSDTGNWRGRRPRGADQVLRRVANVHGGAHEQDHEAAEVGGARLGAGQTRHATGRRLGRRGRRAERPGAQTHQQQEWEECHVELEGNEDGRRLQQRHEPGVIDGEAPLHGHHHRRLPGDASDRHRAEHAAEAEVERRAAANEDEANEADQACGGGAARSAHSATAGRFAVPAHRSSAEARGPARPGPP